MEYKRVAKLVEQYNAGDKSAFDRFYSTLYSGQYYYAYKMLREKYAAEDVVQEAFIRAYKNIHSIDNPQAAIKWMTRITHCACVDYIRSTYHEEVTVADTKDYVEEVVDSSVYSQTSDPEKEYLEQEKRGSVKNAIDTLSNSMKSVVVLKYYHGFKEREIAEILDIPVGTVKSRLSKSKMYLKDHMETLYSLSPMIWVSLYFFHEAGLMSALPGMVYTGTVMKRVAVTSLVVVGVSGTVASAVVHQAPVITDIEAGNSAAYVNSQQIYVKIDHADDIDRVYISEDDVDMKYQDGMYMADIENNGTYTIVVQNNDGLLDQKTITIDNIDKSAPDVYAENKGNKIALHIKDSAAGVDWTKSYVEDASGNKMEMTDTDDGYVICDAADMPLSVRATDQAGNWKSIQISYD